MSFLKAKAIQFIGLNVYSQIIPFLHLALKDPLFIELWGSKVSNIYLEKKK